ncbi:UV DNA damage repair endonuclease UvsE [Pontibacillus yanchengensis]|uniref:UV DNA damage repair endonuclease UvsE n=2 Tax=Pontibacillus yanchengensis TaxID=462910 RepID=A0ACC7VCG0_9BACI|nr:UV DNA damage repair endonuclease UvsE [Pontibacillus yanchengensis]MYL32896.1 UV DNA damage repair endonuclease UvsE [Pontibacillus yanchengensis]MYL51805.1 UV DNA damage repair endonuclease UvsE [Pontibacillus yanchengensis]
MTIFRLGYVAMSVHVENASPSQTMTYKQFSSLQDREAAVHKLERIASSNLHNTLRLLKHNRAHGITFFRMSSKLVPLATHEELADWKYYVSLSNELKEIGNYAKQNQIRIDFHPDHFVVLNTPNKDKFKFSLHVLKYHYRLLHGMGIDPTHRCVLHLGGGYNNKEESLERFIENWSYIPTGIQKMIMLENDDTLYTMEDCLYISQKLMIPFIFDIHHHLANYDHLNWEENLDRVLHTWEGSSLPVKMHISSPKSQDEFKSHAPYIDKEMFLNFVQKSNGSTKQIDCMIEAKQKDDALFRLVSDLSTEPNIEFITPTTFKFHG